ncbi:hypothetical protein M5689_004724 [Euphorbia peplus]|nr:hypothetical protein M5689_004724 [Euphorbia peplus]
MEPKGTIIYTTVGRPTYGFDIFSLKLPSDLNFTNSSDTRLTDGLSINYNAQFINPDHHSIVYISERNGFPCIYSSTTPGAPPKHLPSESPSLFHDRPVIRNNRLYFISAHEDPHEPFKSWSALYYYDLNVGLDKITRLSPYGVVDFSPAVSRTGDFVAVASYGSHPWRGEFFELDTEVVVFKVSEPEKRMMVCEKGGWPSWGGDHEVYFHRKADDGWWSVFRVSFTHPGHGGDLEAPVAPIRVTPPGVHCFTPAVMDDGKRIAVATRRRNQSYRHIEIFEVETSKFYPVTEMINPNLHHYNPFVSENSEFLGYHRFRGDSGDGGEMMIPNLERVVSPIKGLRMLRLNGSFPAFSPAGDLIAFNPDFVEADGGLRILKSDGTKRWSLLKNRVAFCNSWSPTEKHVIYTSVGPIFEAVRTPVQVARVTFHPSDLINDEIAPEIKILTRGDTGNNAFPSCSPDGKSIVFRSGRSGEKNLYIMDAVDGEWNGSIQRLTEGPWIDTMPSWSPKGDLIAFSSNRHNPENSAVFSIYTVKTDGSDVRRIHVAGVEGSSEVNKERINHVCWSKDGEWMLFTSNMGSVTGEPVSLPNQFQPYGELYVMKVDGSELRRLTWNGYEDGTPTWFHGDDEDLDFGMLNLDEQDGDKLNGKFDEPIWIKCDM